MSSAALDQRLAQALLRAVRSQHFELTADSMQGGAPVGVPPSIDLAVAAFPADAPPVFANVLFSREHPQGLVADIAANAGPVRNIAFVADQQDAEGNSIAWLPGSDWAQMVWQPLVGANESGAQRFVAPYPASLLKLMLLVGVAREVDAGNCAWDDPVIYQGRVRPLGDWAFDMTVVSCNIATSALVAHLHALGALDPRQHRLHTLFESLGLTSLRLANTQPDGGWGNAAGAGVGQIQMTAWDTLRLLWLLDPAAPPAPWLQQREPLLGASLAHVLLCLREQGLHEILSSSVLAGLPPQAGWVRGLPARLPARWLQPDGSARLVKSDGTVMHFGPDLRLERARCDVSFAHKTGNTDNYSADAGIVQGIGPARRHYLIALTSNLGRRYAPPGGVAPWGLVALGGAVDDLMRQMLGD